ncbi:biopolymer transporter ExbD [Gaetbulibacter aestuarii]
MADIAFLLLIFFLVTASISSDQGITRMLPKDCPTNDCDGFIAERNILQININNQNEIMVNNEIIPPEQLKDKVTFFVDNNGDSSCSYCHGKRNEKLSENPEKAVISIQYGKKSNYKTFIYVQDEITKAFYELRSEYSAHVLNKKPEDLTKEDMETVKKAYPFKISEAKTR